MDSEVPVGNLVGSMGQPRLFEYRFALAEQILQVAKLLDEGQNVCLNSLVTDNGERASLLDAQAKAITAKALLTALEMKRIAMTKESKKHSRANNSLIDQWRNEIEALQRALKAIDSY